MNNKIICIYKIVSPNNRVYIGQTTNWNRRKSEYYRNKAKGQPKLNRSFLKYGIENHIFSIVEICESSLLNELECNYIDLYNCITNGLNSKGGGSNGYMPQDIRNKISIKHKNKILKESTKEKLRSYVGEKHHGFGKTHLFCTKYKMFISAKNRKHTQETKDKLSKLQREYSPNAKFVIDLNTGVFYDSPRKIAELYNLNLTTLRCWLNGSLKNKTNFSYC